MSVVSPIATYFNVSLDYLMGKESSTISKEAPALTKKDERDISKKLEETLNQLTSLRNSMEMGKKIAKQKYTPKKYR